MATPMLKALHKGFLSGPAPNLTKTAVQWTEGGLPEYEGMWAVILDGVMSKEECGILVAAAESSTDGKWERAMVNVGGGRQSLLEDTRNCGRIILDNREIVAKIWSRIAQCVPEIHRLEKCAGITGNGPAKRNETWKLTRLNERMRFLKYTGSEYFRPHCDGTYETPDLAERSYFTLHLYLNESNAMEESLVGGATTFHSCYDLRKRMDIVPKTGRILLFQHRNLLHSGDDVINGTKLTMRTDIMYAKEENETSD